MKTYVHDEQFDGVWHAACGRVNDAVSPSVFEATDPRRRCRLCERIWFPNGQPDWHLRHAQWRLAALIQERA